MGHLNRIRYAAQRFLVAGAILLVGLAGLAKCADLPYFEHHVESWTLLSPRARALVVLLVPPIEVGAAAAWILGIGRQACVVVLGVLLAGATAAYAVHLLSGLQPRCGCSGGLAAFEFMRREGPAVILRNAILLAMLGVGLLPAQRAGDTTPAVPKEFA